MGFFDFIPIVGPVVSAVTGAIANDANNKAIQKENAKQRQFSHDEAILAHNRQLEIMDKQNDWNSYTNQRRLLTDAGYNPNALFNSSSTLSVSSGASGGAQASAPSIGMPNPTRLDIGTLSDAALKMAQAKNIDADTKNIDADTEKKESETIGQDLQNSYQKVVNKFLESNIKLDMDKKDAERALNDAQRLATHTSQMLDFDELHNLRPNQVAKTIAETNASNASALLSRAQAAKTDTERDYIVKDYILRTYIAAATVADLYSQKQFRDTQNTLWQPEGVLYQGAYNENLRKKFEYDSKKQFFDDTYKYWKNSVLFELDAKDLYNIRVKKYMDKFEINSFGGILIQGLSLGRVLYNYRNPGAPISPTINFPY